MGAVADVELDENVGAGFVKENEFGDLAVNRLELAGVVVIADAHLGAA